MKARSAAFGGGVEGLDEALHGVDVLAEGSAALGGNCVGAFGAAAHEGLFAGDVAAVFELSEVDAESAVGGFEPLLERGEVERAARLQRGEHAEAHGAVHYGIEAVE